MVDHEGVRRALATFGDAFGKLIADGTTNALDLPSIYPFSPERYRLRVDGTRTKPDDTTSFEDGTRDFVLSPAAGETVEFYTAERPRYVVGYDAAASFSFEGLTELETGDEVQVKLTDRGDNENGAAFTFTPGENKCTLLRGGDVVDSQVFEFPTAIDYQSFIRPEIVYNAYDAGRWLFTLSYTDSSRPIGQKQVRTPVAELAIDDEGATDEYNFNLSFEATSANGNLEVSAGSVAYQVRGDVEPTLRVKALRQTGLDYQNLDGAANYEPLFALRKDPTNPNIAVQLSRLSGLTSTGSAEFLAIVVDQSQTDATGFETPVQHNSENSVIQTTTNVTEFPDETDTVVTNAADPGGYQIGFATSIESGTGSRTTRVSSSTERKRPIHNGDVCIILGKQDNATTATHQVVVDTEQDW